VPNVAQELIERLAERVDLRARDLDLRLADLREVARAAREDARRHRPMRTMTVKPRDTFLRINIAMTSPIDVREFQLQ